MQGSQGYSSLKSKDASSTFCKQFVSVGVSILVTQSSAEVLSILRWTWMPCLSFTKACTALCVHIDQAKHDCLWYKCYVQHCPCRLIAHQYELEHWVYYIDSLGKFDYGPAYASSKQVILCLSTKTGKSYANRGIFF